MNHKIHKYTKYLICVFLCFLYFFSVYLRIPKNQNQNYLNSDATYHTLLTIKALNNNPIKTSKFLPIITLSPEDRNIPWGATVPDKNGNYYYTSFMPIQFVAPYLWFKTTNLKINETNLYYFNSMIGFICLLLSNIFFIKIFKKKLPLYFIILSTSFFYIFSPELMHMSGLVYWGQSLFQLVILIQLIIFVKLMAKPTKTLCLFFLLLCILTPMVEWTGYASNLGFLIIVIFNKLDNKNTFNIRALLIIGIVAATIISLAIFVTHFLLVLDPLDFYNAIKNRFVSRSIFSEIKSLSLINGYASSFKSFLYIPLILVLTATILERLYKKTTNNNWVMFFLLSFPLLENLIMKEHAVSYSYDRAKMIFLLIFLFLQSNVIFNKIKKIPNRAYLLSLMFLMTIGTKYLYEYSYTNNIYRWIDEDIKLNKPISEYLKQRYYKSNSIFASDFAIRGYANLLFDRGIYERQTLNESIDLAKKNKKKYVVYLEPKREPWQKDIYNKVQVIDLEKNKKQNIVVKDNKIFLDEWILLEN